MYCVLLQDIVTVDQAVQVQCIQSQPSLASHHQSQSTTSHTDSQLSASSHHTDETYSPDTDTDYMDTTNTQPVEDICKYLVFESELVKLLRFCPNCGSCITDISKTISGSCLTVSYSCFAGHSDIWRSQPLIHHMPAGNLLLSAAILLSGATYSKTEQFSKILSMPILSRSEYFKIQKIYLIPVINDYWTMHQTAILSVLSSEPDLRVCGDARSDSPGYSAKYSSYTIMDMKTSLIIDQQLVSLADDSIQSSVAMETEALDRSLEFVISSGLKIQTMATDRHNGVQSFMKQKYPKIDHQFDVWHFSKNITKKLHKKALSKEANELMPWIRCISNHLFYCSQTCCGDPQLLKEKWMSCIHHVVNRHHFNGERMTQCEHGETDDDIDWMTPDSGAHKALKSVVLDQRLLKDIDKLTGFCHTGQLEVYHSMLLKYAPKREHFHYDCMQARLQLAALDHNHNVDRDIARDKDGKPILRQVFSKAGKDWIVRQIYDNKQYDFLDDLLRNIVSRRHDKTISLDDSTTTTIRRSIATSDRPDRDCALQQYHSRFH